MTFRIFKRILNQYKLHINKQVETTIHDVLQFRQSVSHMGNKFPFSLAFGPAKTREDCIESSQNVFEDLLLHTPGSHVLPFDTIALVALDVNGHMDEYKIKKLIKLLRPDKEGNLSRLDFVKSCDSVYKRMRMLHAAITISGQIDHAAGKLINLIFYFVLGMIVLTICNLNPLALFLSLSGLILSFAFMFGSAASTYFEVRNEVVAYMIFVGNPIYTFSKNLFSQYLRRRVFYSFC